MIQHDKVKSGYKELWEQYFPEFLNSTDPAVIRLIETASLVKLPAGEQVFHTGSQCQNYLLMLEGSVKTQLISESGREVLLYHVRSGDSCVLTTSCLLAGDSYPAEGISEEDAAAFIIPGREFNHCLEKSSFFRQFVFKNFAVRLSSIIKRMEEVVFDPIDIRLGRVLLEADGMLIIRTHQDIASDLGTAREVVSRQLKRFETLGWVKLSRGAIEVIDYPALKNLCGIRN